MRYKIAHDGDIAVPFDDSFQWKYVVAGLLDYQLYLNLICYVSSLVSLYSVALSLPSIVKGLGYTTTDSAQLHSVPPYIVAAFTVVTAAWAADKYKRVPVILSMYLLAIIGWTILYTQKDLHARYAGTFLAAMGSYASFPPTVSLLTSNIGGKTKRATVIGFQVGVGGLAGTISSNIFRAQDAPRYLFGFAIDLGFCCLGFLATLTTFLLMQLANRRKQQMIDSGRAAQFTRQELAEMGDDSPYFKYVW